MSDISRAFEALEQDFISADNIVSEIYDKYFASYFKKERAMHIKFQDSEVPITDSELEWIITSLPLDLFSASNALALFKQHNEIVKLKIKQRKKAEDDSDGLDEEFKLMSIVYTAVITQVEQEISFSKELIMGAKKVWDARRRVEQANPISEVNPELPDYNTDDKVYPDIKGVNF